jgi:hypothetical protein
MCDHPAVLRIGRQEFVMRRVLVVWGVGLALLLAGAAVAQGWTTFSPDGGRLRVDMPAPPTVGTAPISWGGEKLTMTEATARLAAAVYLVSYVDYPDRIAMAASSDVMLDKVRHGMASGNTLRGEQKITLGRAAGREFTITEGNGGTTAVRLYWARNRLYQLLVTGRAGIENQADTRRFFDSFALVRP